MWYVAALQLLPTQYLQAVQADLQSWGTKGSDKASEDLGNVKSSGAANKNEVTADLPVEPKDLNDIYQNELQILATKAPKEEVKVNAEQKQEDYYKNFRTNVSQSRRAKGGWELTCRYCCSGSCRMGCWQP